MTDEPTRLDQVFTRAEFARSEVSDQRRQDIFDDEIRPKL